MKKFIIVSLFILTACTATETPLIQPTSTSVLTSLPPTAVPTSTIETVIPTVAQTPTQEPANLRVSLADGMPQVYIPAGTFRMGGMDVRRAPNETPDHDVTLAAFWLDQLEVT